MILLLTLYLAFSMLLLAETSLPLKQLVQEARARTTSGDRGEGYDKGFFPNLKRYQVVLLQNIPLQPSSSMQTFNIYQKIYRLNPPIIALRKQPVVTNEHPISARGQSQPRCKWEACPAEPSCESNAHPDTDLSTCKIIARSHRQLLQDSAYLPRVILTAVRQH